MRVGDLVTGALGAFWINKLRSGLTVLGIVIGVGAVVAMLAMTSGFEEYVNQQFSGLGSNTFQIQKWPAMRMGGSRHMTKWRKRQDITIANADAVRERDEAAVARAQRGDPGSGRGHHPFPALLAGGAERGF
jgi:putative ABC transport system permease protein